VPLKFLVLKVEIENKKIETDMLDGDGQQDIVRKKQIFFSKFEII
jgi:hypothetical protein